MANQGDVRNQRVKLRRIMCHTIHFLTKEFFRKMWQGSLTGDFQGIVFQKKMVYFLTDDFLSDI